LVSSYFLQKPSRLNFIFGKFSLISVRSIASKLLKNNDKICQRRWHMVCLLSSPVDDLAAEVMLAEMCDNFAVGLKGFKAVGDKTTT